MTKKRTILDPAVRKQQLLDVAVSRSADLGYTNIRLDDIAYTAKCSRALVMHYFTTMAQLRRAIMGEAIRRSDLTIIAQGIVAGDKRARALPEDTRRRAMEYMVGAGR